MLSIIIYKVAGVPYFQTNLAISSSRLTNSFVSRLIHTLWYTLTVTWAKFDLDHSWRQTASRNKWRWNANFALIQSERARTRTEEARKRLKAAIWLPDDAICNNTEEAKGPWATHTIPSSKLQPWSLETTLWKSALCYNSGSNDDASWEA